MALNQPEAGWRESDGEKSELADVVVNLLKEHADMLDDYFSMVLSFFEASETARVFKYFFRRLIMKETFVPFHC